MACRSRLGETALQAALDAMPPKANALAAGKIRIDSSLPVLRIVLFGRHSNLPCLIWAQINCVNGPASRTAHR
jgi:hypothetical protein